MAVMSQVHGVLATMRIVDDGSTKYQAVTVSWLGVPGDDLYGLDYFLVERQHSTSTTWERVDEVTGDGELSIEDAYFTRDTWGTFQYRVTPYIYDSGYETGVPGYDSVDVTRVSYPPSMPRSVQAIGGFGAVTVTWTAPTTADYQCEHSYYLLRSGDVLHRVVGTGSVARGKASRRRARAASSADCAVASPTTSRFAADNSSGSSSTTSWITAMPMAPTPTVPRSVTATAGNAR